MKFRLHVHNKVINQVLNNFRDTLPLSLNFNDTILVSQLLLNRINNDYAAVMSTSRRQLLLSMSINIHYTILQPQIE